MYQILTLRILVGVVLMIGAIQARSELPEQFIDPMDGMFDMSQYLSENAHGFLPVPIIITDPALESGLGMAGIFFHETEENKKARLEALKKDEGAAARLIPPNVSAVAGFVTGNDSWGGGVGHMAFWNQGRIRYLGGAGVGDINLDYFGSGEDRLDDPISLNTQAFGMKQALKFKVADSRFFIGPVQQYVSADVSTTDLDALAGSGLSPSEIDELEDVLTREVKNSGLGLVVEFDSRDNVFSPHSGYQYVLNLLRYDEALGGDLEYNAYKLEGLNYWNMGDRWRLGLKIVSEHADSDDLLPPFATPSINLRGVPIGSIQGLHAQSTEIELTHVVSDRWEFQVFAGAGRVSNEFDDLGDADWETSKGVGFRYQIAKRYGFYAGLDYAWGPKDNVFYIQAGSAW